MRLHAAAVRQEVGPVTDEEVEQAAAVIDWYPRYGIERPTVRKALENFVAQRSGRGEDSEASRG